MNAALTAATKQWRRTDGIPSARARRERPRSHKHAFVRSIARRVTVLHEGRVLAEGDMDQVQNDQRVIEVYLGE